MKILLIGCGKMGSALYKGWIKAGIKKENITVVDPIYKGAFKTIAEVNKSLKPDYLVLAVKPQNVGEVLPQLKHFDGSIVISIIAGKPVSYFKKFFPKSKIIRTMPNLPATIGKGVTVKFSNDELSLKEKENVNILLDAAGISFTADYEKEIDAVTAITGSGPAYIYLFLQSLIDAGVKLGLNRDACDLAVIEMAKGSIALFEKHDESLTQLKQNVTSKGGTTEAALNVLEKGDAFKKLILKATAAAAKRSKELSE